MIGALFAAARPALHALDPETAHRLAIAALRWAPAPRRPADDPRLATMALGLGFPNPLGLAAGFDKHGEALRGLARLGFGFVEIGGVTPEPQPGNPRPRLFRLPQDGAVINRYGLNSEGMERVAQRLARRSRRDGLVGVNLGANKDSADRSGDYALLVRRFAPLADFLTINVSSPNTPGLRDLQGEAALDDLVGRCVEARGAAATPVLIKLSPDLALDSLDRVLAVARRRRIDGIVIGNTTTARPDDLRDAGRAKEEGGLSGRPLFVPSTRLLAHAYQRVGGAFPLIGVGGIFSADAAIAKIEAGATLIQIYTGLVYDGPALIGEIKRGLVARLAAEGIPSIQQLVGRRAADFAR